MHPTRMKLLFSSSDAPLVERIGRKIAESGIVCQVRLDAGGPDPLRTGFYPELWVEDPEDVRAAAMLVSAGIRNRQP